MMTAVAQTNSALQSLLSAEHDGFSCTGASRDLSRSWRDVFCIDLSEFRVGTC